MRSKKTCPGIILSSIDYKFNALSLMMICNIKIFRRYYKKIINQLRKTNNHQREQIQKTTDEQHEPIQKIQGW